MHCCFFLHLIFNPFQRPLHLIVSIRIPIYTYVSTIIVSTCDSSRYVQLPASYLYSFQSLSALSKPYSASSILIVCKPSIFILSLLRIFSTCYFHHSSPSLYSPSLTKYLQTKTGVRACCMPDIYQQRLYNQTL